MHTIAQLLAQHTDATPRTLAVFCLTTPETKDDIDKVWNIWREKKVYKEGVRIRTTWKELSNDKQEYLTLSNARKEYKLKEDIIASLDAKIVYHTQHRCDVSLFDKNEIEAATRAFYSIPMNQTIQEYMDEMRHQPSIAKQKRSIQLNKALKDAKLNETFMYDAIYKNTKVVSFLENGSYGIRNVKNNIIKPISNILQSIDKANDSRVYKWFSNVANVWKAYHMDICKKHIIDTETLITLIQDIDDRREREKNWPNVLKQKLGATNANFVQYSLDKIRREYIKSGIWDITLEPIAERCMELSMALNKVGLYLRDDSVLCKNYVMDGIGSVQEIVSTMEEMNYLYTHTDYKRVFEEECNKAYRELRKDDYWYDSIKEEMQLRRIEISNRLRKQYRKN